jgi:hypothetical protein
MPIPIPIRKAIEISSIVPLVHEPDKITDSGFEVDSRLEVILEPNPLKDCYDIHLRLLLKVNV